MGSRRYGTSEVQFDDRRERDYVSRSGARYDDRYSDREIEFRRSAPPVREREREEIDIREERRSGREPAFLREDYGRTTAGPVVLRAREREDFDFSARSRRGRSPEGDRKTERETITIRRDESESRGPRREKSRDREEIIIRRDERERSRPPPPPPPQEREREEIIIRRDERSRSRAPIRDDREVERIVIKRKEEDDRRPAYEPSRRDYDREEIIIRRDEDERRYEIPRRDLDYALVRPMSRERERSTVRRDDTETDEIIIRREEKDRRGRSSNREREREEIIITRERSRSPPPSPSPSPSPAPSSRAPAPPPEPQIVYAPQIHQEVITHHRHVDHGFEVVSPPRPRPISRPPSPPSPPSPPPPARERSEERIEIRRTGERNGRAYDEDIIIDRNDGARSAPPVRRYEERDYEEEDYYSSRSIAPAPAPSQGADIGRRYGKTPDPKAGLWTEVTKDLVVKEAIQEMGYEYEETEEFYYIIAYLKYVSLMPEQDE